MTWNKIAGIVLAVQEILTINVMGSSSGAERGPSPLPGNLLIFGAVIDEALFTIFGKVVSERVTPLPSHIKPTGRKNNPA